MCAVDSSLSWSCGQARSPLLTPTGRWLALHQCSTRIYSWLTSFDGGYIHLESWGRGKQDSVDGTAVSTEQRVEWGALHDDNTAIYWWASQMYLHA